MVWYVRDRIAKDYLPAAAVRILRVMTRTLPAAVIANSHATMTTLDSRAKLVVGPGAIIAPAACEMREEGPLMVGMIGRFAPWKGQDLFLRAFVDAFPDSDTRCMLVGASLFGEEAYEKALHELVDKLGLGARVEFRGFCSDVWPELARMDMLVHASLIPEPFGQVVLEGMAARVPVIAAAAGGPAEIVRHDVDGRLYAIGDQAALARAMAELAGNAQHRARLIDGGIETVAAYHPKVVAARMQTVYRHVIPRIGGE